MLGACTQKLEPFRLSLPACGNPYFPEITLMRSGKAARVRRPNELDKWHHKCQETGCIGPDKGRARYHVRYCYSRQDAGFHEGALPVGQRLRSAPTGFRMYLPAKYFRERS